MWARACKPNFVKFSILYIEIFECENSDVPKLMVVSCWLRSMVRSFRCESYYVPFSIVVEVSFFLD